MMLGQISEQLSLVQKGHFIFAAVKDVFLLGVALAATDEQRAVGLQDQVKSLQMCLLSHNSTPKNIGFE